MSSAASSNQLLIQRISEETEKRTGTINNNKSGRKNNRRQKRRAELLIKIKEIINSRTKNLQALAEAKGVTLEIPIEVAQFRAATKYANIGKKENANMVMNVNDNTTTLHKSASANKKRKKDTAKLSWETDTQFKQQQYNICEKKKLWNSQATSRI